MIESSVFHTEINGKVEILCAMHSQNIENLVMEWKRNNRTTTEVVKFVASAR